MTYRQLTEEEIRQLLLQNCSADSWTGINVAEGFSPENIRYTRFEGEIKLGIYSGTIEADKGLTRACGIYNSFVNNCEIGDHVHISDVRNLSALPSACWYGS